MIRSIGLDIVEIGRIAGDLEKYGERFVQRILGTDERELLAHRTDRALFAAGRFAAKEALIKALGFRLTERPPYRDLQIVNDPAGQPQARITAPLSQQLEDVVIHLSITHERSVAAAVAIVADRE